MNAQQLKNSILQEAIEGRLVPQDPNDEPASVLLERIRKEKKRLVKEGKLKKKDLEEVPVKEDEINFDLPKHWLVMRLGEMTYNHGQKTPLDDFSYIDIGSIDNKHQKLNEVENIIKAKDAPSRARKIVEKGDVVYATVRPYLHNLCIIDKDFSKEPIASTGFAVLACVDGLYNKFLFYYLLSPIFDSYANDGDNAKGMAYPAINDKKLYNGIIPLPPLAEQHRIVAKIEELLPEVEEYGKAQEALDKLNAELPERLKKSILQEAIEGRLVPQDPNEESASVLLDNIRKEKKRLVKEGKLKKKDLEETPISEDEIPFKIPESWEWVRLKTLVFVISGTSYQKGDVREDGIRVLRGGNIKDFQLCLFDDDVFIPKSYMEESKNIRSGDVIIVGSTGSRQVIGKPAFILQTYPDCQIGAFLRIIRPLFGDITPYVHLFFSSEFYRENIRNKVKGTNIYNIKGEYLEQMMFPLPPLKEQHRIVLKIEQLLNKINQLKEEK